MNKKLVVAGIIGLFLVLGGLSLSWPAIASGDSIAIHGQTLAAGGTAETKPADDPAKVTVYATRTGAKYHADGCRYLSKSKIPLSLKDAKAKGLTPCSVCKPPQ